MLYPEHYETSQVAEFNILKQAPDRRLNSDPVPVFWIFKYYRFVCFQQTSNAHIEDIM
jgi:hypothetical protein